MRARLLLVLILVLLGGYAALAQIGLLPWPSELVSKVKLATHEDEQKAPAAAKTETALQSPPERNASEPQSSSAAKEPDIIAPPSPETAPKKNPDLPALTIARISSDGPSVFGGTAKPNSQVTVLDGANPVGSATANDSGDWSLVTDYKFASTSPNISLRVGAVPENAMASAAEPPKAPSQPQVAQVPSAPHQSPATQLLKNFADVVAAAREEAKQPKPADTPNVAAVEQPPEQPQKISPPSTEPSTPPQAPVQSSQSRSQALLSTSPQPPASTPSQPTAPPPTTKSMPVPITFVFNEASLTADGRSAAHLLLEYLTLKKFASVTLSGHADERGLPQYNMELSRERLQTIERVLRDGGYHGKLDLIPKGATEPFMGIDRSKYAAEDLYQLDRRVELRVAN